jgi:branched-chain amino acid transport system permease protein
LGGLLRRRFELPLLFLVLAGMLLAPHLMHDVPPLYGGLYGIGFISGCLLALQAVGVVLVYRTNGIINFAQVQIGAVSGIVLFQLMHEHAFLRLAQVVCPPCGGGALELAQGWPLQVNFWLSVLFALALGPLVGYLCYFLVIKRFRDAPRLVVTILTIALGQLLAASVEALAGKLPFLLGNRSPSPVTHGIIQVPYHFDLRWSPVVLHIGGLATAVVALIAMGGLALFFRLSRAGNVIRASSENPARAETLGVKVVRVGALVWVAAGLLSGLAAILQGMEVPTQPGNLDVGQLERSLAVAVVAGLTSMPVAAIGGLVLGLIEEGFAWSFTRPEVFEALLFGLVSVYLLLQQGQASRAEIEASSTWRASREVRPIPPELRGLPPVRRWLFGLKVLGVLVVLGSPFVLTPSQTSYGSVIMVFAIVALSLLVLTGWAGQISLGQFAIAGVGAYVTAFSSAAIPFPLSVALGAVAGALGAAVIGIPAIRLRGLYLAIATLAFAVAVSDILVNQAYLGSHLPAAIERPLLLGLDLNDERVFYYLMLAVLGLSIAGVTGLRRSRTARALIACRDNERAAQSFGIHLARARLTAFVISGFMAGAAGGFFVFQQRGLNAGSFLPSQSVQIFLMAVVGGFGSVLGPPLGAVYTGGLQYISQNLAIFLSTGLGLILLFLLAPGGVLQVVYGLRDVILRRVALRYGIVVPSLLSDRAAADGNRAPLAPNRWRSGIERFTPIRYRLEDQAIGELEQREASAAPAVAATEGEP